jgi:hypothetical protein
MPDGAGTRGARRLVMPTSRLELIFERPLAYPERRAEVRHCVDLVCVVRRRHWRPSYARVVDLSAAGMLLAFQPRIDEGEELGVSFKTAQPPIRFEAHARVARLARGRRKHDSGPCVGLRFESLSAVAHLILRGHLRNLPRPACRREPPSALRVKGEDYASFARGLLEARAT